MKAFQAYDAGLRSTLSCQLISEALSVKSGASACQLHCCADGPKH